MQGFWIVSHVPELVVSLNDQQNFMTCDGCAMCSCAWLSLTMIANIRLQIDQTTSDANIRLQASVLLHNRLTLCKGKNHQVVLIAAATLIQTCYKAMRQ